MTDEDPAAAVEADLHGNALQKARSAHASGNPKKALKLLRSQIWQASQKPETLRAIASDAEAIAADASGRLKSRAEEVAQQANLYIQLVERAARRAEEAASKTASSGGGIPAQPIPRGQRIALSETSIVLATVVGIGTWFHLHLSNIFCSVDQVSRGANIGHGLSAAVGGGLLVSITIPILRRSREGLAVVLLLGVLSLGGAIAFVAADSATWTASGSCGSYFGSGQMTVTDHVNYLYVLWGLPLLVLAWKAAVYLYETPLRSLRVWLSSGSPP